MTPFTQLLSQTPRPRINELCALWGLSASGNLNDCRSRLKAYMDDNMDLTEDDTFAGLFTQQQRNEYAANPYPPAWEGIQQTDRADSPPTADQDVRGSSATPGNDHAIRGSPPLSGDYDRAGGLGPVDSAAGREAGTAQRQLLQSLPVEALDRLLDSFFSGRMNDTAVPPTTVVPRHNPVAVSGVRRRPDRIQGSVSTDAGIQIIEPILNRFLGTGNIWAHHIPLHLLTDAFCRRYGVGATTKDFDDNRTLDKASNTVLTIPKDIPFEPELRLSLAEWTQAWKRLMYLIERYVPQELNLWQQHYFKIMHYHNRERVWPMLLAYDSRVRRASIVEALDPSVWQTNIWEDVKIEFDAERLDLDGVKSFSDSLAQGPSPGASEYMRSATACINPLPAQRPDASLVVARTTLHEAVLPDLLSTASPWSSGRTSPESRGRTDAATNSAMASTARLGAQWAVAATDSTTVAFAARNPVHMALRNAHPCDFLPVVTPLLPDRWDRALMDAGVHDTFRDVPIGLRDGFNMGITSSISRTYTPKNHYSAVAQANTVTKYIQNELSNRHYTGPFSATRLEALIGPFRSSPLGTVPKSGAPGEFRIVQDFSFPRNDPSRMSVNSEINIDDFPCEWGSFSDIVILVIEAPPGTEAATLDVDAAYRRCPIHPTQQPHFVVEWNGVFYIDHVCPFGFTSSGGIFGRVADAMAAIYRAKGIGPLKKWVDDFVFFRFPLHGSPSPNPYSLSDIYDVAKDLGWPWKQSKTRDFASEFIYLGFHWNITDKSVSIPDGKKSKYIARLLLWTPDASFTVKEAESLLGTLVHCSLPLPEGKSRLPAISKFAASFAHTRSPFSRRKPNATVLDDVSWWLSQLHKPFCGSRLMKPPSLSGIQFFVDASTSWGIGVVFDGVWQRWRLTHSALRDGRDIGWAEMIAIELGLRLAIHQNHSDVHFNVHSDNAGVLGALSSGKSRSMEQNRVLRRIVALLRTSSIWISCTPQLPPPSRGSPPAGYLLGTLRRLAEGTQ
ncbi:unnamed protein product [Mycena citricolor]|uniref:Uncharacterized protein n=1 Tax=Mycena citricolor TaxID=2018698 RepID=A0AAD2Q3Q8_9AGAR|nr:unnamed protein product [Mycena citricolor]